MGKRQGMVMTEQCYNGINYLLRYPAEYDKTKKYPVILFLHGAGSRGSDLSLVKANPFFGITGKLPGFPFITVAPQCDRDTWFDMFSELIAFSKHIYGEPYTDPAAFYLIGASMGGYGAWQLAMSVPELFAAIAPVCGGGMYWNAARLVNVPVWAFHGENDNCVDVSESVKMTKAVAACGGSARLTVYKNCGHNAWDNAYSDTELYAWLLKNKKSGDKVTPDGFRDPEKFG